MESRGGVVTCGPRAGSSSCAVPGAYTYINSTFQTVASSYTGDLQLMRCHPCVMLQQARAVADERRAAAQLQLCAAFACIGRAAPQCCATVQCCACSCDEGPAGKHAAAAMLFAATAGFWSANEDQLAAGLPCNETGHWHLLYQVTFTDNAKSYAWITVDNAKPTPATSSVPCSTTGCPGANATVASWLVSSNPSNANKELDVKCSAGQW